MVIWIFFLQVLADLGKNFMNCFFCIVEIIFLRSIFCEISPQMNIGSYGSLLWLQTKFRKKLVGLVHIK
jgi:hypothetical protein